MLRNRRIRRTYGGRLVPRRPIYPRILRRGQSKGEVASPLGFLTRGLLIMIVMAVGFTLTLVFSAYSAYAQVAASLKPRLDGLQSHETFETSRIYDRNGTLLYEFFETGKRTQVNLDEVSELLIHATIAIEDKTFFTNAGVDYEGIARTLYSSFSAGEETGGASTITQQVIKSIILTEEERLYENRYQRKLKEIILAQELNQRYDKDAILELYLNEIYYGNLAYGIEAASEVYFNVTASDLSLAQASLLAGLPQLPTEYNPINFLQRDEAQARDFLPGVLLSDGWEASDAPLPVGLSTPKWRQIAVLRQMVDEGYITEARARIAIAEDLVFAPQEVPLQAPHFVFYVRSLLEEKYGKQLISGGGLEIYTTLDLNMQRMVQQFAAEHIQSLADRNIHNASVVVMHPRTGQILAMVGSIDYNAVKPTSTPGQEGNVLDGQVNVAVRERQPGSALKPFTYLAAMERGMTPATILWDVPTEFPLVNGEWYAPENYNGRWNGPVRMRAALANSLNMPAVKALRFTGLNYTLDLLDRVGIRTGLKRGEGFYGLSLTLGGGEVTLLELTSAYNTLANQGRYLPPTSILRITDSDGDVVEEFESQRGRQVVSADLVSIITNMMSDDEARAPVWGRNSPLNLSLPAAVKTGTSNDWRDAWTVGFTPYVTVGVWSGNNNNEPTEKVESLQGGGIIWHNVMEELFTWIDSRPEYRTLFSEPFPNEQLPTDFMLTAGVQRKAICRIPGPFGGTNEELFTADMIRADQQRDPQSTVQPELQGQIGGNCDFYTNITVVRIPGTNSYCIPRAGERYSSATTLSFWKIPPQDPDIRVQYRWSGGGAGMPNYPRCSGGLFVAPTRVPQPVLPTATPEAPEAPIAGAVRMPNVIGMGEAQARGVLAGLGISSVYADTQTRERIPDVFDLYAPGMVISTLPRAGDWVIPGTTVVLGVRGQDTAAPQANPTDPPAEPLPPQPQDPQPVPQPTEPALQQAPQPTQEQPPQEQPPQEQPPAPPPQDPQPRPIFPQPPATTLPLPGLPTSGG